MVFSHLEDIKIYFEDCKIDWSPRELHLAELLCTKTSQLERQRQKYLKWQKRAEELEWRLETWMETMYSELELYTEILVEDLEGQHVNLTSDSMKTWRRKQEKEDGEKERNNKKQRAAEEKKERKEKKEREAKEKKERKEHERKLKKEKKEREEKERKERKEQERKENKQKEHEKKEKKERKQQEKKVVQNVCEKKDEEKEEKEAEKKREKKKVTFCERVTIYTFSWVTNPCLCQI
ncbi:uncharacterized protein LOC144040320 [Vanacampus margaritifer]